MVDTTKKRIAEKALTWFLRLFLFFLPWQTIWIFQEQFFNGVKWEYGTLGFYATDGLLWVSVVLFAMWYWKEKRVKTQDSRLKITKDRVFLFFCFLFTAYCLLTTLWALDKDIALQHSLYIMEAFLLFIMLFAGPLSFKQVATWFVAGAILPSILGIWQFLAQSAFASTILGLAAHNPLEAGASIVESESIGRVLRAYGPFSHPNVFGGYLVVVIMMVLFLRFKTQDSCLPADRARLKIILFISYFLFLISLFFTFSRSAWIAFIIVTLLHCYIVFKTHNSRPISLFSIFYLFFPIILFILLTAIYFPVVKTRFIHNSLHETQSTTERVSGYQEAWQLFKLSPMLGVGAGNYTRGAYELNPNRGGWEYQPVHNVAVLFAVEFGVVGVVLVLGVILSCIMYHVTCNLTKVWSKQVLLCYMLYVTCYVILASFDHYLLSSYVGLMLSSVYLSAILRFSPDNPPLVHKS